MRKPRLTKLPADAQSGRQRRCRILWDKTYQATADVSKITFTHVVNLYPIHENASRYGGFFTIEEAEYSQCESCLAGSTLAHKAEDFALG
jgi:hypothetical protein